MLDTIADILARDFVPDLNENAISLIKQPDGNWIGRMQKSGTVIEIRDIGPETVLQRLLTHE